MCGQGIAINQNATCLFFTIISAGVFNQLLYFVLRQHTIADNPDKDIIQKACDVLINCTHKNPTVSKTVPCVTDVLL